MNINKLFEKTQAEYTNSPEFKKVVQKKIKECWDKILDKLTGYNSYYKETIETQIESQMKIGNINIDQGVKIIDSVVEEELSKFNQRLKEKVQRRLKRILNPYEGKTISFSDIARMLGIALGSCDFLKQFKLDDFGSYDELYFDVKDKSYENADHYVLSIRSKNFKSYDYDKVLVEIDAYFFKWNKEKIRLSINGWKISPLLKGDRNFIERFSSDGYRDVRFTKNIINESNFNNEHAYNNHGGILVKSFYWSKEESDDDCYCYDNKKDKDEIEEERYNLALDAVQYIKDILFKLELEDIEVVKDSTLKCDQAFKTAIKETISVRENNDYEDD